MGWWPPQSVERCRLSSKGGALRRRQPLASAAVGIIRWIGCPDAAIKFTKHAPAALASWQVAEEYRWSDSWRVCRGSLAGRSCLLHDENSNHVW